MKNEDEKWQQENNFSVSVLDNLIRGDAAGFRPRPRGCESLCDNARNLLPPRVFQYIHRTWPRHTLTRWLEGSRRQLLFLRVLFSAPREMETQYAIVRAINRRTPNLLSLSHASRNLVTTRECVCELNHHGCGSFVHLIGPNRFHRRQNADPPQCASEEENILWLPMRRALQVWKYFKHFLIVPSG